MARMGDGSVGGGMSSDSFVEDLKCRGNDDEDHHSRNLSRNMDVGRISVNDELSRGRSRVRRRDEFSGTPVFGGGI